MTPEELKDGIAKLGEKLENAPPKSALKFWRVEFRRQTLVVTGINENDAIATALGRINPEFVEEV